MVGDDRAMAGLDERADEVSIQVTPGGVAVEHHDRFPVAGTLVHVVHAAIERVEPARLVGPGSVEVPVEVDDGSA
jgi:hypothetical protein